MINPILPINFFEVPKIDINLNQDYISNLIANNMISDFFLPSAINQNPFFSNVQDLNEKIGILQTATNSIDKILSYVDILKNVNPEEKDVINDLTNEINSIIKNTTFNSLPVFNQTLKIGDKDIDLSLPLLDLNNTTIDKYEELLKKKESDIFNILNNITFQTPINSNFNPFNEDTFESIINSGLLTSAYKTDIIDPYTLELLFS